jgi:hypothetical protein
MESSETFCPREATVDRVLAPGPILFKVLTGLTPPGTFLLMVLAEVQSSCGTGMIVEPCVALQGVSRGRDKAKLDVHTGVNLEIVSSRRR